MTTDIAFIDTHCHLDGPEFSDDLQQVVERAKAAGVAKVLVPAIDAETSGRALELAQRFAGYVFPMLGLHPEEVRPDWPAQLERVRSLYVQPSTAGSVDGPQAVSRFVAVGEVGLDFYWSREFEKEQLAAFEQQVQWSAEWQLPLMIHCRKAQNEMVQIIKRYARDLPGGVFHCFTGNAIEAAELLQFDRFVLGIGGVLTFKKSHLPEVLPQAVPLSRIVLETDAPYMAPVPHRGQRNEPAFVREVLSRLAQAYGVGEAEVADVTNQNVAGIFGPLKI